jgi:cellulose synthase/poly-beta-1,6-N-acetylglucosamine synthase-like glycosyltransferase
MIWIWIMCLIPLILIVGSFIIYPLVLWLMTKGKILQRKELEDFPMVSLIVAAYNEEDVIEDKIKNAFETNYPKEKLEIIIMSDASSDKTDDIVLSYKDQGVKLFRIEGRKGKTHCQNYSSEKALGEYLVYSDANSMFEKDAVKNIVEALSDESVGVVIGKRIYVGMKDEGNKEGVYEKYEARIKQMESIAGGTIGANGSIYGLKKENYIPLSDNKISDIVEPLMIASTLNKKIIQIEDAIANEEYDNPLDKEFGRKQRIVLRAMNSLWEDKLVYIRKPGLFTKVFFHKVVRWLTLPLILISFLASIFLNDYFGVLIRVILLSYLIPGSILFFVSNKGQKKLKVHKVLNLILYSFTMFASSSMALLDFFKGKQKIVWESRN